MKIGLMLPALAVGGAEQVILSLAVEYLKRGHEVEVMGLMSGGAMAYRFQEKGIRTFELNLSRSFQLNPAWFSAVLTSYKVLTRYLMQKQFDVVHTHLLGPDLDGLMTTRRAGIQVVIHTIHNTYAQFVGKTLRERFKNGLRKRLWPLYDKLFAVDEEVRDWAVRWGIVNLDMVEIVRNGIDFKHLHVELPREDIRDSLGWKKGEIVLLNVGSLTPQKNQKTLIEMIALLERKGRSLKLAIAGGGVMEEHLKDCARSLGIGQKVAFLGVRQDVPLLLKAADVFVFPSLWEGLPISILEAMAAGLPVVASDLPVHRRLTRDGCLGRLCKTTPKSVALNVVELIEREDETKRMAYLAREEIRRNYSAGLMAEEYLDHYRRLILRKRKE